MSGSLKKRLYTVKPAAQRHHPGPAVMCDPDYASDVRSASPPLATELSE